MTIEQLICLLLSITLFIETIIVNSLTKRVKKLEIITSFLTDMFNEFAFILFLCYDVLKETRTIYSIVI